MSSKFNQRYLIVLGPKRAYATFTFTEDEHKTFYNDHFELLLKTLGKHLYSTENIYEIARRIKEDYNKQYHFGRMRNAKKRISVSQIKALLKSYNRMSKTNRSTIVRIPFSTMPIVFYLLSKYLEIMGNNPSIANSLEKETIGKYLCSFQIDIIRLRIQMLLDATTDEDYQRKCSILYSELAYPSTLLSMCWNEFIKSDVDYVVQHWT